MSIDLETAAERRGRLFVARRDLPAVVGGSILIAIVLMALLAPYVTPHDPNAQELRDRLLPPAWLEGGSAAHLLGTDRNGRDMLARIAYGARLTLLIGVTAVFVGGLIGVTAGALAGFVRGWVDLVVGRIADVQQAIPFVVLALAVVAVVGSSLANLILVLGAGSWLFYFRVVRGEVLAVRERPFVEAAVATGVGPGRLFAQHILPNVLPSIIVVVTLFVPNVIVFTAGLSFLGLGVPPPTAEWGRMIADGVDYLGEQWWLSGVPSAFLVATVLGINLVGDWLRDVLDPVQRWRR
jgi:peptide/nickel transport system permease protein